MLAKQEFSFGYRAGSGGKYYAKMPVTAARSEMLGYLPDGGGRDTFIALNLNPRSKPIASKGLDYNGKACGSDPNMHFNYSMRAYASRVDPAPCLPDELSSQIYLAEKVNNSKAGALASLARTQTRATKRLDQHPKCRPQREKAPANTLVPWGNSSSGDWARSAQVGGSSGGSPGLVSSFVWQGFIMLAYLPPLTLLLLACAPRVPLSTLLSGAVC